MLPLTPLNGAAITTFDVRCRSQVFACASPTLLSLSDYSFIHLPQPSINSSLSMSSQSNRRVPPDILSFKDSDTFRLSATCSNLSCRQEHGIEAFGSQSDTAKIVRGLLGFRLPCLSCQSEHTSQGTCVRARADEYCVKMRNPFFNPHFNDRELGPYKVWASKYHLFGPDDEVSQ